MRTIVIVASMALLAGCVTAKQTVAPDGRPAYSISCNGGTHDLGDCYSKAGEMCPSGFNVVAGESGGTNFIGASGGTFYGGTIPKRTIIVECKT